MEKKVIMRQTDRGFALEVRTYNADMECTDIDTDCGTTGEALEDVIAEAALLSKDIGAVNAKVWEDYAAETIETVLDMDDLEACLLAGESCDDYQWAFDPGKN